MRHTERRRRLSLTIAFALVFLAGTAGGLLSARAAIAGVPICAGDCDENGDVGIEELVRAVSIALGTAEIDRCASADGDADGVVSINELVRAVNHALEGCPEPGPDLVVLESLNLKPEGIEYDAARGRFLVGSRTAGIINAVADDGTLTAVVSDPGLDVTLGLHIDRAQQRLLAAGVLEGADRPALGIFDLASGEPIHVVDLGAVAAPGMHLANDVVSDAAGNAYVTDTLAAAIYRVDPDGQATVFADGEALRLANGIEIHDERYLIVATLSGPSLLRVPLDDPEALTAVGASIAIAGDGIVFTDNGDLAVVTPAGAVQRWHSADDWQTAALVGSWDATQLGFGTPTTAATRGAEVYVIFAHLFDAAPTQFEIARAQFAPPPALRVR